MTRMKRPGAWLLLGVLLVGAETASAALPVDACTPPSYYPSGPSPAATDAVAFTAYDKSGAAFVVQFWREPCFGSVRNSLLWARFACGTHDYGFAMLQGGPLGIVEYGVILRGSCSFSNATTTYLVEQDALATMFRNSGEVTLIHRGGVLSSGTLGAYSSDVTPVVGLWWTPNESGSGYNIDVKNGVLVLTTFSYQQNGEPQWYISSGPLVNGSFSGKLNKTFGGQCISCPYTGPPSSAGDDGDVTINFSSPTFATMYLPGGRVTYIQPQAF